MAKKPKITALTSEHIDTLLHYADGEIKVRHETGLDRATLIDLALDHNVELCPNCKVWQNSYELIPDWASEADGKCGNCRTPEDEPIDD